MLLRSKYLSMLVLICLFVPLLANCAPRTGSLPTVTIAVVEADPGSAGNPNPQSAYAGVKLAVDQFKKYNRVNVRVDLYSDGNDQAQAAQIAEEIARSNAIAVIGHSSIETSNVAGGIYDENKIPVVNVVPVTEHLTQAYPYHFNITYTAESEAAYLASYLIKLDERTSAGIIHTDDEANDALQKQFRNLFARYGGAVTFRETVALSEPAVETVEAAPAAEEAARSEDQVEAESEPQTEVPDTGLSESETTQLNEIVARIAAIPDVDQPDMLVILAEDDVRAALSDLLRENGVSIPVSGAEAVNETDIAGMLKPPTASIIYTEDGYGSALARQFRNTFTGLGGKITFNEVITVVDVVDRRIEDIVSKIISAEAETNNPGTLFIATDDVTAVKLVVAMKRKGISYPIIGASSLSTPAFLAAIEDEPESTISGYFTDGILTTRALIFDSANRYANQFLEDYQNIHNGAGGGLIEPGDRVINGYEAALALVAALQNSNVGGTDTQADRESLYKALLALDDIDSAGEGLVSPILFEPSRNILRAARFGVYQNGEIVSANVQFEPIAAPGEIRDLQTQIERGRIMTVNGRYVYKANVVYAGVDILSIQEIDIKTSTYKVDFYLWFRYRPNDRDTDFKPDEFVFTNAEGEPDQVPVREELNADGTLLKTYRVSGVFKGQFRFHEYPFDRQNLIVEFRNQNATTSFIQYVVDRIGMRYESEAQLLGNLRANGAFDSTFGWREQGAQVTQDIFPTFSTFGSPQNFGRTVATNYSLIKVNVDIQRDSLQYILKSLLPLLITLILAYITFFLPLGHSERLAVGSTALLTTAFFHLTLADALPEIGYTVAMEFLFYASYVISALIVLLETLSIRLEKQAEEAKRQAERERINAQRNQWNTTGRVIYPTLLLLALGMEFLVYNGTIRLVPNEAESRHLTQIILAQRKTVSTARPNETGPDNTVKLTLSTWRPEDEEQIGILLRAFEAYAQENGRNIVVEHRPIVSVNYDSILDIQLSREQGPDLFYVRPFSVDGNISKYLRRLNDELPIDDPESFNPTRIVPWRSRSGDYYALPFVGVVQGVYYNQALFTKYGLRVPTTWDEFLRNLERIKRQDPEMIPIANVLNQTEDSEMFMSLAANFLGGPDGRENLMKTDGTSLCYNSQQVVTVFQAIEDLKPYLPEDADTINSQTSKELFFNQKAVMLFGGSWDLNAVSQDANFAWNVFAPPGPASRTYLIFQPDIGIGINRDTQNFEEARLFLEWLMSEEAVKLTAESLAGFYPLHKSTPTQGNGPDDEKFLTLVTSYPTDIRWMYTEISNEVPSALEIVRRDLYNMLALDLTPEEAAQNLHNGLGEWYEPAQNCQ